MITLRTPSGDKAIAAMTLRTPTGDKGIARATLRTPSGDKVVFDSALIASLTVDVSPISAVGSGFANEPIFVTTNSVTATATGGTAPYSFAWSFVSGSTALNALSPASDTTRFRATLNQGELADGFFEVTATDLRGRTGTVIVPVSCYNFGSFGGF